MSGVFVRRNSWGPQHDRQHMADRSPHDHRRQIVESGWLGIHDHDGSTKVLGDRHHIGHWKYTQTRANTEQQVALLGRNLSSLECINFERLTKGNRCRLEYAATGFARRIAFTSKHSVKRLLHWSAIAAIKTLDAPGGAVDFDDLIRVGPSDLMESIDVLSDEGVQLVSVLERQQRAMATVWIDLGPDLLLGQALPVRFAMLRVIDVGVDVRLLLGPGVFGPHPLRSAKVRDSGVGRDPGAREDRDLSRLIDEVPGGQHRLVYLVAICAVIHVGTLLRGGLLCPTLHLDKTSA